MEGAKTSKKGEGCTFLETLKRCTFLQQGGDNLLEKLVQWSLHELCFDTMLNFLYA
jgi:hypothetical protein